MSSTGTLCILDSFSLRLRLVGGWWAGKCLLQGKYMKTYFSLVSYIAWRVCFKKKTNTHVHLEHSQWLCLEETASKACLEVLVLLEASS